MEDRRPLNVLVVAATEPELRALRLEIPRLKAEGIRVHGLATGIGMVNTGLALGQFAARQSIDLAFNIGIAGAYPASLALTQVVQVVEDSFAEMGAESPEGFIDLETMGFASLIATQGRPEYYNTFPAPARFRWEIPAVKGITVNKVSGTTEGIARRQQIWQPEVETMEGAAFFQACHAFGWKGYQFRAISNRVEPRDRSKWQIGPAIKAVQDWMRERILRRDVLLELIESEG